MGLLNHVNRPLYGSAVSDNLEVGFRFEASAQARPKQSMVVDY